MKELLNQPERLYEKDAEGEAQHGDNQGIYEPLEIPCLYGRDDVAGQLEESIYDDTQDEQEPDILRISKKFIAKT